MRRVTVACGVISFGSGERAEARTYKRIDAKYYCPGLIKYKYRFSGSGWLYSVSAIIVLYQLFSYISDVLGFKSRPESFLGMIGFVMYYFVVFMTMGYIVIAKIIYRNVSGLANLPGYDPETKTIPELTVRHIDPNRLWCDVPMRNWFRWETMVWFITKEN